MDQIEQILEGALKDYDTKIQNEQNAWAKDRLEYDRDKIEYRLELHRSQKQQ